MLYTVYRFFCLLYLLLSFYGGQSFANIDYYFWPTLIRVTTPDESGALFSWPEYKVLLQNKSGTSYVPALVDDVLAQKLNELFMTDDILPIRLHRDSLTSSWGMSIPGGFRLCPENLLLMPLMLDKFVQCLSTLSVLEVEKMQAIIDSPLSMFDPEIGIILTTEQKHIATTMLANFQRNRCENGNTFVPEMMRHRMRHYISLFLTGEGSIGDSSQAAQLVIATLFHDLLFSSNGLWVRTTLAMMQEFISARLIKNPLLKETSCLKRDYESFLDFVMMAKDTCGVTKEQFLTIAKITDVNSFADIFKPFPLLQYILKKQLLVVNLELGTKQSTQFFSGVPK